MSKNFDTSDCTKVNFLYTKITHIGSPEAFIQFEVIPLSVLSVS